MLLKDDDKRRLLGGFSEDENSNKYLLFNQEANRSRAYMTNRITLVDMGLEPDNKPWVRANAMRRIVDGLRGKMFMNPIKPKLAPFENDKAEEDVRKIADAVWAYEAGSKRGIFGLNLIREIKQVALDALIDGIGHLDMRIDDTLRTVLFINGMPIYQRIDPLDVRLDTRAGRTQQIRRLHIRRCYTEDEIKAAFNLTDREYREFQPRRGNLDPNEAGLVELWESQYLKVFIDKLYELDQQTALDLNLTLPPSGLIWGTDLETHIKNLRKVDEIYRNIKYSEVIKGRKSIDQQRWGCYSCYHTSDKMLNDEEYYLGKTFTISTLRFFQDDKSPYGLGVPYYLRDLQKMETIAKTQQFRILQTINRSRILSMRTLSDKVKEKFKRNELGGIIDGLGDDMGLNPDIPLGDQLMFESSNEMLPYISQFINSVSNELNEQFGSYPSLEGGAPFSGASGKLVERLQVGGMVMFSTFRDEVNWFLSEVFDRCLKLAMGTLPKQALFMIAAENDPERAQLIDTGLIYDRLNSLNVDVTIDTTSEEEKGMMRQLFASIAMRSNVAIDPVDMFSELGVNEPVGIAQRGEAYQARMNQIIQIGQAIMSDPNLQQVIIPMIDNYMKQKASMEAKIKQ
jgi:hypothetical protein